MPRTVLMTASASAPAPSTSRAISAMSVTFGESLTINGLLVTARAASVAARARCGSQANVSPSLPTLGHEMFNSIASISSRAASRCVT